jgi:hypothetical protein
MMRGTRLATILTIAALLLALEGCAVQKTGSGPEDNTISSLTVYEAKHQAQSMEDQIVALVPAQYIAKSDQLAKASLLSCNSGPNYQWAGGTTIELKNAPAIESILHSISAHWKNKSDYTVEQDTAANGTPRLTISSAHGAQYLMGPTTAKGEPQFQILSFSPCFKLPSDMDPGALY